MAHTPNISAVARPVAATDGAGRSVAGAHGPGMFIAATVSFVVILLFTVYLSRISF